MLETCKDTFFLQAEVVHAGSSGTFLFLPRIVLGSTSWYKLFASHCRHSEPTRTTPSQCSRGVGHSFRVVEAQRTSSNLQETHHHRVSTVCRVLLHFFGVVQAPRTDTNHTSLTLTELARCEGCFGTRAGWFKNSKPPRTYTNHTSTE